MSNAGALHRTACWSTAQAGKGHGAASLPIMKQMHLAALIAALS